MIDDWRRDSLYRYNGHGYLIEKKFYNIQPNGTDSSVLFYENRQIYSSEWSKQSAFSKKMYEKTGRLKGHYYGNRVEKQGWYRVLRDSLNRVICTSFRDAFTDSKAIRRWSYDTLFHQNEQPYSIQIENEKDGFIKRAFYDPQGILIESIPPDTAFLM